MVVKGGEEMEVMEKEKEAGMAGVEVKAKEMVVGEEEVRAVVMAVVNVGEKGGGRGEVVVAGGEVVAMEEGKGAGNGVERVGEGVEEVEVGEGMALG